MQLAGPSPRDILSCKDISCFHISFISGNDFECPKQVMSQNSYVIFDPNWGIAIMLGDIFTSIQN